MAQRSAIPSLSLIIAVYNKPEILRLVLAACARQSIDDFEVLVADDGSGPAVADAVREAQHLCSFPITHLWHEDLGWRKNMMLNNAVRTAQTDYLVFIDGDCLPSRHFLLDHRREREAGRVLLGRRVEMSQRWSSHLSLDAVTSGAFDRYGWSEWVDGLRGDALRLEDGLRMRSPFLRKILLRTARGMLGSNFSAWKRDLVAINGFDELYTGPGCGEDSDIEFRLSLIGVTGKSLRNLAVQYHIYHPVTAVSDACWDRFQEVKQKREPRCRFGLERLP